MGASKIKSLTPKVVYSTSSKISRPTANKRYVLAKLTVPTPGVYVVQGMSQMPNANATGTAALDLTCGPASTFGDPGSSEDYNIASLPFRYSHPQTGVYSYTTAVAVLNITETNNTIFFLGENSMAISSSQTTNYITAWRICDS